VRDDGLENAIIMLLAKHDQSIAEISKSLQWPQGVTLNTLHELRSDGAVRESQDGRMWMLTPDVIPFH
jgi:DNA-binding IclR family transcriptional regulator